LINKEEKGNIAAIFKAFDVNNDGKLSKEEIQAGFEKYNDLNMCQHEFLELFD